MKFSQSCRMDNQPDPRKKLKIFDKEGYEQTLFDNNKWHCTCMTFEWVGHCCHLNMIAKEEKDANARNI